MYILFKIKFSKNQATKPEILGRTIKIASVFYGCPSADLELIGVTGTNGKSTTAWVLRYLVGNFVKCGYIGTIGMVVDEKLESCQQFTKDFRFLFVYIQVSLVPC